MEWMLLPLKRYADFGGRSRRMEFWLFTLGVVILYAIMGALFIMLGASRGDGMSGGGTVLAILFFLVIVGLIIPSLAVQVRRFHDQDRTGWMVLLNFVPYVGGIVVLVFMCLQGTRGPNRYGPDPLDPTGAEHLGEVFR